jgi:hypothetical protein
MNKYNVYLFQPQFSVEFRNETSYWIPYSIGCIWSYAQQFIEITDHFCLKDLIFKRENPQDLLDRLDNPSIVGFSIYVWNQKYCLHLAKLIKERWPDCLILIGGPQANILYTSYNYVDCVILAEGEEAFVDILRKYTNKENIPASYSKQRLQDLDIPSPYTSGVFDKIIKDNPTAVWSAVLETNRGCPYACTFCDWGSTTYSKVKRFSLDRIQAELDWIVENPIVYIFCADANFGMFKERDLEIAKLIKIAAERGRLERINVQYAKNSTEVIFEIAKALGNLHTGITVSVQSMNEETLKAIKRKNMDINNISHMLALGEKYQVSTYTECILGLPNESLDSWCDGLCEILEMGQHGAIDVYFCQILENSELNSFDNITKYKIKTVTAYDYMTYDNHDDCPELREDIKLINSTNTMSTKDMCEAYLYSWVITNFHSTGYTQWYARYARYVLGVPYRKFYDLLLNLIKKDTVFSKHYYEYKDLLTLYLHEGKFNLSLMTTCDINASGHGLILMSSKFVYDYRHIVYNLGEEVLQNFTNNTKDVRSLQENFMYDNDIHYPIELNLSFNISNWDLQPTRYSINTKIIKYKRNFNLFGFFSEKRSGNLKNVVNIIK